MTPMEENAFPIIRAAASRAERDRLAVFLNKWIFIWDSFHMDSAAKAKGGNLFSNSIT